MGRSLKEIRELNPPAKKLGEDELYLAIRKRAGWKEIAKRFLKIS